MCVAVTETFHDVASYHMLHADKQEDGSFAITANSLEGRTLPDEKAYAGARALLSQYFENVEYVMSEVKAAPRYNQNRVSVGCIIEDMEEMELFKNSVKSGAIAGVNKSKFCIFTTTKEVSDGFSRSGIRVIYLSRLSNVGRIGASDVGSKFRRYFLQAWLAFAVSSSGTKMLWQAPGTIWLERPDNIVNIAPIVEALWHLKEEKTKEQVHFLVHLIFLFHHQLKDQFI